MTPKLEGFTAVGVKHSWGLTNLSKKGYGAKLIHLINQSKFHTYWREHSMFNEIRGPVTQWNLCFIFYFFIYFYQSHDKVIYPTSHTLHFKTLKTDTISFCMSYLINVENCLCCGEINPRRLLEFLHFSHKTEPLILLISTM
jgi:hypothetical protein